MLSVIQFRNQFGAFARHEREKTTLIYSKTICIVYILCLQMADALTHTYREAGSFPTTLSFALSTHNKVIYMLFPLESCPIRV